MLARFRVSPAIDRLGFGFPAVLDEEAVKKNLKSDTWIKM